MTLVLHRGEWLNARNLRLTPGEETSDFQWLSDFVGRIVWSYHDNWVPVTTTYRVLGLRMEERPPIWRVAAFIYRRSSRRQLTKGGTLSCDFGEVLTTPHPQNRPCYETDIFASGLGWFFCATQAMEKGHEFWYKMDLQEVGLIWLRIETGAWHF